MIRQTVAHVDLDAIRSNFRAIAEFLGAGSRGRARPGVIAVVKANAYGHGAAQVALALEAGGRRDAGLRRHRGRRSCCARPACARRSWCSAR